MHKNVIGNESAAMTLIMYFKLGSPYSVRKPCVYLPMVEHRHAEGLALRVCPQVRLKAQ